MANYIAIVHKEANTDFGVSFPDFPGCVTAGQNVDEAKDLAQEALSLHIQGMIEDGGQLPTPSKEMPCSPILDTYSISFRIVFEQYSPTSASPSTGRNNRALFEYKHVTEAGKSSSAS